jgi:hypothetical protein
MPHRSREHKRRSQRESYRRLLAQQPWRTMFLASRRRARESGTYFDLTLDWFEERWTGVCELTGLPFELGNGIASPYAPSVDRIRPDGGYTQDNCRLVLLCVNMFKGRMDDKRMREVAEKLV